MLKFDKKLIWLNIVLVISVSIISSCTPSMHQEIKYNTGKFFDLKNFVSQVDSDINIDEFLLSRIDPQKQYFAKEDYIQFSENFTWPGFREPWKSITHEIFDLYLDYRLLNNFTLIFTRQSSDKIVFCIIQDSLIDNNFNYRYYFLDQRDIVHPFGMGMYDVYGFHNDMLVFKSTYSQSNFDYSKFRNNESPYKLDSLKL